MDSVSHENHRTWHLHLNDVQEADRGRYLCQINTAQAKTQSAYLNIVGELASQTFVFENYTADVIPRLHLSTHQFRRRLKTVPAAPTWSSVKAAT